MQPAVPAQSFQRASQSPTRRRGAGSANPASLKILWRRLAAFVIHTVVNVGTLPYYRFFRQNTLFPILHIADCVKRGESEAEMAKVVAHWRERKLYELQFIQVASTILAAGVVGCFSWTTVPESYWLGPALWYSALVLSILALLLSSSQAFIFTSLNAPTADRNSKGDYRRYLSLIVATPAPAASSIGPEDLEREAAAACKPRWNMVFTWQSPMMLMAYGVCFFLVGLTLYVCTPFFNGEKWTDGVKTAIFYLVILAISGAVFAYCSFWAYKYIDLDKVVDSE